MAKKNRFLKEHIESNKGFADDLNKDFTLEQAVEETLLNALHDGKPFVDLKARLSEYDCDGKNVISESNYGVVFYAKDNTGHRTDFFQKIVDYDPKKGKTSLVADAYIGLFSAVAHVKNSHVLELEKTDGEHKIFKDKVGSIEVVSQNPSTSLSDIDYKFQKLQVSGVGEIPEYVRVILNKPK